MIDETMRLEMAKLGFGLMRLPKKADAPEEIDVEETKQMVDLFLEAGLKYFDTAFVYKGSEDAIRQALVERHPRESYYLANKLNAGDWCVKNAEEAKAELETSLQRTGAGYFDFYLLHALSTANVNNYEKYGIWDYAKELKEKGLIRHIGFSFHDRPEVLETILKAHPEVEFVQLQLNYADWNSPTVCSKENYEVCVKYQKPVVVMEPVKGGILANPPKPVADVLRAANPNVSLPSWAIRYVASLENVMVVLSGMSNVAQMKDNLSYMKAFKPLDSQEQATVKQAMEELAKIPSIPCTACHYCTNNCPMNISIPDFFAAMNKYTVFADQQGAKNSYETFANRNHAIASDCIQCGQCEDACPQHLPIRELLKKTAATFDAK